MLRAGRVFLRPAERDDLALFVRWLGDKRTSRFLAVKAPFSLAMEERWFEDTVGHQGRDRWHFVICRIEDERPVGAIALHDLDQVNGGAGLGIVIGDPGDTSRGYGSDAIAALLEFAFGELRLVRVWLEVDDVNERARHVYERLGFVHEATFRHGLFRGGRHVDVHRMAVLAEDWEGRSRA
jgi:RimJ/RimL family protein N-acetyltransferase